MEWSRKGHVIVRWIKIVLRAYSLVRRLCHDLKYRSLHSKPTLSHTSPFSSRRKDIRSRDSVCFFRRVSTPTQRPSLSPFLPPTPPPHPPPLPLPPPPFTLHSPCNSSPHTHLFSMPHFIRIRHTLPRLLP